MTRVLPALFVLALAGCRTSVNSLDHDFREAQHLLLPREQYGLALTKAEAGLSRAERMAGQADVWRFRLLKADILIGRRLAQETIALLDKYGEPPSGPDWNEVRAHILLLRGRSCFRVNRLRESEDFLASAAIAAKQTGSESLSTEVLLRQGALLVNQSKFAEARSALQSVAVTAARLRDSYMEATAFGNLGYGLLTESRHDEAIPWFEKAIALFTGLGAGDSVARTHGNRGICYSRLGDYDNARLHYGSAQEWYAKTGDRRSQQIWFGNSGNLSYALADYEAAENSYKRALDAARQVPSPDWIPRWLTNLAAISLEQGKLDAAEMYNGEALEKMRLEDDKRWEPTALVNGGRIEEAHHRLDRARELFRSALTKQAEDPHVPLDAHAGLARTYALEGRLPEAEAEFLKTLNLVERSGAKLPKDEYKLTYLSSLIHFYRAYVDFLVSQGKAKKALEVAESSRSHLLAEKIGDRAAIKRYTASDYQRLAGQTKSVLLEYWLSPGKSYLWVITPQTIRLHPLPPATTIQPLIERYRAVIAGGRNPLEVESTTGRQLYQMLLGPASEAGVSGNRFIIVQDGALSSFPLETLPTQADPRKFWIEQATVSVAPSLNFLASRMDSRSVPPKSDLLVIGDPPSSSSQFPRLEFASGEIDEIKSLIRAGNPVILRGEAATPDSYTRADPGRFGFIHFAAHATANAQSPLDSAVILAGPAETNRLLARDVMAVPLSAELVTISACRSAGAKTYAGEGLVGFAWAFLGAGARNVIAGLWDVSDRSTAQLMSHLYREIAAGKKEAPEALRAAKLALIHSGGAYEKPLYWAPFQLYTGSPR